MKRTLSWKRLACLQESQGPVDALDEALCRVMVKANIGKSWPASGLPQTSASKSGNKFALYQTKVREVSYREYFGSFI